MKKTLLIAALLVGLLLFAGGYGHGRRHTTVGDAAPVLAIPAADSVVAFDRLKGEYVILNFWSSTDAPSRRDANLYTAWLRRNPDADVRLVGVNFDDSEGLFREIVRRDSLVAADQYYVRGDTAQAIIRNYGLSDGYGSVLINPEGKIVAYNPTDAVLDRLKY